MWNWTGTPIAQNVVLFLAFVVNVVTLVFLIKYVRATKGIQEAANKQTEVSQGLLRAANVQSEASGNLMAAATAQAAASERLAGWQPEQWRRDSRGQEWREFIGTLTTSVSKIEGGPQPHPFAPRTAGVGTAAFAAQLMNRMLEAVALRNERMHWLNEALLAAARVIGDRLLIAGVLKREHIREEWKEIERMAHDFYEQDPASAEGWFVTITTFQGKWAELRQKLILLAQQDLGVAVLPASAEATPRNAAAQDGLTLEG
jgi:hypothetical protein